MLGKPRGLAAAQLRLMLPVSAMSGLLNNTPIVALMIPLVSDWARRIGRSPSKLLLPLSFGAILGGTCTLIGTSTNLVVAGLAKADGLGVEFGLFDVTPLGLAALVSGTVAVVVLGSKLLPESRDDESGARRGAGVHRSAAGRTGLGGGGGEHRGGGASRASRAVLGGAPA